MEINISELIKILRLPTVKLFNELKKSPYAVVGKHYVLWYRGERLPCLVAHIDHVYSEEKGWDKRPILYSEKYIWSPVGVAGDDRCGVYAVMKLFNELEVNALFTNGEEKGGIGASEACEEPGLASVPYFIEIDRRGFKEAVFYNNEDELVPEFAKKISKHFTIGQGSFTDISILGKHFRTASVNLSAGFYNEHQKSAEYIYLPALEYTIKTVPKLISELGDKKYELPKLPELFYWKWKSDWYYRDIYDVYEGDIYYSDEYYPECMSCSMLEYDRDFGYYCWELEGVPDVYSSRCLKSRVDIIIKRKR
jgi:hypothetical protein